MRTEQCNYDGRVYEDERVRDDDEGWALRLATAEALAPLLYAREVIAAFKQKASDEWQGRSEAGKGVG